MDQAANTATIYVLHEKGSPSHVRAMEYLLKPKGINCIYHEFSILHQILSGIKRRRARVLLKQFSNVAFLFSLPFRKKIRIVLGIAPYDYRLAFFRLLFRRHSVFYLTSWHEWTGDYYPQRFLAKTAMVTMAWKAFIEQDAKGLLMVTQAAANSISAAYRISVPVSVVRHSYNELAYNNNDGPVRPAASTTLQCIFVGRIVKEKGIREIIRVAESLEGQDIHFSFVGEGGLVRAIKKHRLFGTSLFYRGYVTDSRQLGELLKSSDVLLLPSKKINTPSFKWEELFGIAIIEALACGVIPVSTAHVGPSEIMAGCGCGFLIPEPEMVGQMTAVLSRLQTDPELRAQYRQAALRQAENFRPEILAERWGMIIAPEVK